MDNFDEIEKLKGDKKIPFFTLLKRTVKYIKPELPRLSLALVLLIISLVADLILPLIVSSITENLTSGNINLDKIIRLAVMYFVIGIFNMIVFYFESMILQKAGQNVIYNLRLEVFEHIESMSQNQFDEMPVGSLVTRVTSYTQSMSDLFTDVIVSVIRNLLTVVGVYAVMIYLSAKISLLLLPSVILVFVISFVFSKVVGGLFRKERKKLSELNSFLNENLSGMRITQLFNQEKRKAEEFDEKNSLLIKSRFKTVIAFGIYRPLITFIYVISLALTFYFGVKFGIDAPEIVAFYLYISKFFNPIQQLADQVNNIQKALTASERLFNLLDVAPEVRDKEGAIDIERFEGKIEFRNVWFAYKNDNWILKDVSFTIEPRTTCAFVGATGAGKTTILGLIVRNYEIQKGQILIDGIDISNIRIQSLRRAIGQMLQDVFLFSGTIKTNITLHNDTIKDEEVMEACRYVNADSFINRLSSGLNEEVIERGENLSQGERQLLSFARTALHKPQILILDEATANIDTETEVIIQKSLEKIKNIGTMLIVAHRLSTIQHADKIIVLQNGEIVESGNHQQLLAQKGQYYRLYQLQFNN